jgi:hypothetical protein
MAWSTMDVRLALCERHLRDCICQRSEEARTPRPPYRTHEVSLSRIRDRTRDNLLSESVLRSVLRITPR